MANRPYCFNASLDPSIAVAMLNLAIAAHISAPAARKKNISEMRLLDPCTGYGTCMGAAYSLGIGSIWGSDINPQSVSRAKENLASLGLAGRLEGL